MENVVSESDSELNTSMRPKPKRRRLIDPSRIATVSIYSNKVNSSLQLKPNLTVFNDDAGDCVQANLWAQSPSSAKTKQISDALTDSEESSEEIEKVKELDVHLRSPSPPPPPQSPAGRVSRRANRKILEIDRKLNAVGSPLSTSTEPRRKRHDTSPSTLTYSDDDVIIMSPNNSSEKPFSQSKEISLNSRELQLKFRCRTDVYKILVLTSAPLCKAVEQLSVKLKVPPSRIILLRKDIELPVQATADELGLGIADIIDCVVIAVAEKQVSVDNVDFITVRLKGKEKGSTQEYSLHKNAPFGSILSEYLSSLTADTRSKTCFLFDGSKITDSQTPAQLDMEDGDVIEVWD